MSWSRRLTYVLKLDRRDARALALAEKRCAWVWHHSLPHPRASPHALSVRARGFVRQNRRILATEPRSGTDWARFGVVFAPLILPTWAFSASDRPFRSGNGAFRARTRFRGQKSAYLPHGEARQMPFQASPSLRACLLLVRHFGGRRGPMPRLRRLSRGVECERLSRGGASFAPHPSSPPRFGFARCPAPLILAPSKRRKDGRCRIGCEGLPMGALSPSHQARDSATCPFRDASGGLRPKAARRGAGASSLVVLSGVFDEPDEGLGLRFEA